MSSAVNEFQLRLCRAVISVTHFEEFFMGKLEIDFDRGQGLIPAIVQDWMTNEVLMVAYMSAESWAKTQETGQACFGPRSRKKLWLKGETSGHVQVIKEVYIDCDNDALLLKVEQVGGAACHTGHRSCFYRRIVNGETETVGEPVFDPKEVYGGKKIEVRNSNG